MIKYVIDTPLLI